MALKKTQLYGLLWSSCDELRGGVDVRKHPIQGLLFVLLFIKCVKVRQIKQGMMQELLTGKIRLV
jgi:type I restriction enzyme M protein